MLQVKNVCKTYRTGTLTQQALDHVSLSLRDSEFVAILGQSGSGKTTLLNVIGGLDCYDEGDLVINGVSTRQYSSRDWDAYRNHTVGFVFQSYNLIPHQTILKNVELALTIGGVSRRERGRRAAEALEKVGLGQQLHKKPAQLSGGQMQRVAIARALVNDPDILLADEPTGALDSETSVQVMDLLQEVARDRLVVMVTHNPELAEQYATRIVNLKDGVILSDSDPFEPEQAGEAISKKPSRVSMSFLTALSLSFNNLWTKKARTVLVAFAGSIGIIGIAMILSMSNGVDRYIQNVEEETLQSYPLQITDTSFDLASLAMPQGRGASPSPEGEGDEARELRTVTNFFSQVSTNDLAALRSFLESGQSNVYDYVQAIEYDYNVSPQIYSLRRRQLRQVNPDRSFAALGFSSGEGMSGFLSSFSSTDTFHAMPEDEKLYKSQYEVKAGRWPAAYNECVLVLSSGGRVTDLTLYTLGLKDPRTLDEMVKAFAEGNSAPEEAEAEQSYRCEDFLGIAFRLLYATDYYSYDGEYGVWADRSGDESFLRELAQKAEELEIVGVVQPGEDADTPTLTMGINYPAQLVYHIMEQAAASEIVRAQQASPEVDVFTGKRFGEEQEQSSLDLSSLFSVDEDALSQVFRLDEDAFRFDYEELDLSGLDLSGLDLSAADPGAISLPELTAQDIAELLGGLNIEISAEGMEQLFHSLLEGYEKSVEDDPAADLSALPQALREYLDSPQARDILARELEAVLRESTENLITTRQLKELLTEIMAEYDPTADGGLSEYLRSPQTQALLEEKAAALREQIAAALIDEEELGGLAEALLAGYEDYAAQGELPSLTRIRESFTAYLNGEQAGALLSEGVAQAVDAAELERRAAALLSRYSAALAGQLSGLMEQLMDSLTRSVSQTLSQSMGALMDSVSDNMLNAFQGSGEALAEALKLKMDGEELRDLTASLFSSEENSFEGNLKKLGYAEAEKPSSITIYPLDFDGKTKIKTILEEYNDRARSTGEEERVIVYTDVVDTLMSSVTDIVNAISYVLIAFVGISLVVSSVMIGVITYISVLERSKEIGVLRAIGASRRNISQVFNAETFIIGGLAGILGVAITLLLLIPANHVIHALTEQPGINAALPPAAGVVLILLSIALTLLGGIIPSRKAARSDPVAALRSE